VNRPRWLNIPSWLTPPVLVSALALSVSALALAATCYFSYENHKFTRLSARPLLDVELLREGGEVTLDLANGGSGGARIEWLQIFYHGESMPNWETIFNRSGVDYLAPHILTMESPGDLGIAPYGRRTLLRFNANDNPGLILHQKVLFNIRIEGCYCSVYDDCRFFENGFGPAALPHEEDRCPDRPTVTFGRHFSEWR
jgi:hypothetical protein